MATKAAYHHGKLRPALIAAALRELAREGIERVTLRGVARRAGVSAPAIYRHFEDKDDLLIAVASECADRLGALISEAVASAPADPLERFRATGIALVRFAVANPEHYRALSIPGLAEKAAGEQPWLQTDRAALADAQARGLIADVPLEDLLLTAHAAMNGLAQAIVEGRLGEVDLERATELAIAVTAVLGHGFAPRAEPLLDPCEPKP